MNKFLNICFFVALGVILAFDIAIVVYKWLVFLGHV